MRYEAFQPLNPPRPGSTQALPLSRVGVREQLGAWAQIKKNGTSNVLYVGPDRLVRALKRQKVDHKRWHPISETHRAFADLPGTGWYVFCAELLHRVGDPHLNNINYIHDILVADGEYLVGSTFAGRQALLKRLFPNTVPAIHGVGYRVIDPHTWLAVNYLPKPRAPHFAKLFLSLDKPEDEGIVLKMPEAKLVFCHSSSANDHWQFKCRRATRNLAY